MNLRPAPVVLDPGVLEEAATAWAAVAARWQEYADAAASGWASGGFVGAAARAYDDGVALAGRRAQGRADRLRRRALECWVLADLVRAGGPVEVALLDEVARRDVVARAAVDADVVGGRTRAGDGLLGVEEAATLRTAEAVQRAVEGREAVLWTYDPGAHGGDGAVVVGVGDVTAPAVVDHVVLVPGVGTETVDVGRQVARAEALVAAARGQGSVATAGWFWLGYDTPDGVTDPAMVSTRRAEVGGAALAADVAHLQAATAETASGEARWTVVGHSYGATTVAQAASGPGLDVDAVVLVGSPGAGAAREADDLGVGRVFVGRDSRDVVAAVGGEGWVAGPGLGRDPAVDDFGAVRFRAERADRAAWRGLGEAHSGYFTPGSESMGNIGAVVAGAYDRVEVAAPAHDPWWGWPRDPEWSRERG